jgi:hypothetical protein
LIVGGCRLECGGGHAASLACVWMEASGKRIGRDLCAQVRYGRRKRHWALGTRH